MKLFKQIVVAAVAIVLSPVVLAQDQAKLCRDDPRMYAIQSVINKLDAGEQIKPLKLTADTFLALTPDVRAKLQDNIKVYDGNCIGYQVYKGKPPVAIKIPFESQLHFFTQALARGDEKSVRLAIDFFAPEASSIHQIIQMVAPLDMAPPAMKQLSSMKLLPLVGMGYAQDSNPAREAVCNKTVANNSLLDIYVLFGGKAVANQKSLAIVAGNEKIGLFSGSHNFNRIGGIEVNKMNCNPYNVRQVAAQLKRAAADIIFVEFTSSVRVSNEISDKLDKLNGSSKDKSS